MPPKAKQAVASGHPWVTETACDVLQSGGNAVDAIIAAAATACVAEPILASLGGGGLAIIREPGGGVRCLDFWIAPPNAYQPGGKATLLDWPGGVQQPFIGGACSVGVWGMPAGLAALAEQYASCAWKDLIEPARHMSLHPPRLNQSQAEWLSLLHGLWDRYGKAPKQPPETGEAFAWPDLHLAMSRLQSAGADDFYHGQWAEQALDLLGGQGPIQKDLDCYSPIWSDLEPMISGELSVYAPSQSLTSRWLQNMIVPQNKEAASVNRALWQQLTGSVQAPGGAGPSTTSIVVQDLGGLAGALVLSNGSTSGLLAQGVALNNVGGEVDLLASSGWNGGNRFPTRMCPLIAESPGGWMMMGAGGSERITSASLQTIYLHMWQGLGLQESIENPRVYLGEQWHFEPGSPFYQARLTSGQPTKLWQSRHQYFGGVNAIAQTNNGMQAWADSRRQGAARLIG